LNILNFMFFNSSWENRRLCKHYHNSISS
jgi:hypothetical protein